MGAFFRRLIDQAETNARRAVETYVRQLPEYRPAADDPHAYAGLLDFALYLRRRTAALSETGDPFTADDLGMIAATGKERGERGVSLASQRHVLLVHADLTLQEVREAAGSQDLDQVMRVLGWLGPQGAAAQNAFTEGYLDGQRRRLPAASRMRMLAALLLAGDPAAAALARSLGLTPQDEYLVVVVRVARRGGAGSDAARPVSEAAEALLRQHGHPLTWQDPDELVALVPGRGAPGHPGERALHLVQDLVELLARPVAVGSAEGAVARLPQTLDLARQVAHAAPVQAVPQHVHTVSDLFVELGAARVPQVDHWLRDLADRLSRGPDLAPTLEAFYRHDMNRLRTAVALGIHPRTLDYRLQRVRDLTTLHPSSTHGVRILSATVTRILAGTWTER